MENAAERRIEISDVHAHLQDKRLGEDWQAVEQALAPAREQGVLRFVCAGTSPADWNRTKELAQKLDGVLPMFGTHPWNVGKINGDWLGVLSALLDGVVAKDGETRAALGEIGLDFAVQGCDDSVKKAQEDAFRAQLALANARAIPVAVHSVRANDRVLKIAKEFPKIPVWLFHGWTATEDEISRAVELGGVFSFSSRNLAPKAVKARETIAKVPRDKILLESDGPRLLPPDGYANAPNGRPTLVPEVRDRDGVPIDSAKYLLETARAISDLRKFKYEEFLFQLTLNERRFFQYWPKKS